ncbi:MAG: FkbM family methyltransferase [Solirubrobacterales bacterium]|nr:FkbM family methyltransferase [Solirubrobacterales bacterium]MBV9474133.1 FkbM family methyltransferase [Solirubrobacterales bacterium]
MKRLWRHLTIRRELASSLVSLAPTRRDRLRLIVLPFAIALWQRLPSLRHRWLYVRLRKLGHTFTFAINDSSELFVLADVLCEEQYELAEDFRPRTILDLGSHIGASIIYFKLKYPDASIFGYEPHPATFRKLERNVGHLPDVHLTRAAAAAGDGPVTLFEAKRTWASSLRADWGDEARGRITVQGVTLETIFRALALEQVDLIKLDVEGAELELLRADSSAEPRAAVIVGEIHDFLPDSERDAATIKDLLMSRGYVWRSRRYSTDHVFVATLNR